MWETGVQSLGREDPLEKETATHSSTIAWKIPWTEELGRLQSMGSQRVGHDWATSLTHATQGSRDLGLKTSVLENKIYGKVGSVAVIGVAADHSGPKLKHFVHGVPFYLAVSKWSQYWEKLWLLYPPALLRSLGSGQPGVLSGKVLSGKSKLFSLMGGARWVRWCLLPCRVSGNNGALPSSGICPRDATPPVQRSSSPLQSLELLLS